MKYATLTRHTEIGRRSRSRLLRALSAPARPTRSEDAHPGAPVDPSPPVRRCRPVHAAIVASAAFPDLRDAPPEA